jgi:chromosome segregation ATPase
MWSSMIGGGRNPPRANDDDIPDDGWGEEDDLVDDSVEEEDQKGAASPPAAGGNMTNMFVGRLTRFLDHVAPPEDAEEDYAEEDGWPEDDDVVFDDENGGILPDDKNTEGVNQIAETSENAWEKEDDLLDEALDVDETSFSQEVQASVLQVETSLNQVLEDIHEQEAQNRLDSSETDLAAEEDAWEATQAIAEIQREIAAGGPVVDHTPFSGNQALDSQSMATSVVTQWATEDGTRDTGPMDVAISEEDVLKDENEEVFGPVVDQVPRKKPIPFQRADSMAVQAVDVEEEEEEEDALETDTLGDDDIQSRETVPRDNGSIVVDQTPSVARSRKSHGESVDAILFVEAETTIVNEEEQEEDSPADYGPVVDQIPDRPVPTPLSGSVMPAMGDDLAQDFNNDDAMDETVFGRGDASTIDELTVDNDAWADEDDIDVDGDEDDVFIGKKPDDEVNESADTTKITSILNGTGQNLVDHTPYEEGEVDETVDPSILVLATEEDLTRDTGEPTDDNVFGEENELSYGPVVDHTPLEGPRVSTTVSIQVEAEALEEDFKADDAMDETCFGDSTIAEGTIDDEVPDGWDEEDMKTPAVNPHLVDQTPSQWESPPPKNADPSVSVLASIDESVEERSEYGPVVDQTPMTPALPTASRSDSIVVQAFDMDTVEDESLNDDDDGDTFTEELPPALRSAEDVLVDRVPPRPESRFGDASTMVVADPSEIMSEVDDMLAQEEERNFGPVVDLTPPSQAAASRPSAAGSTIVFAPNSVASDDLEEDDGDETEANDGWSDPNLEVITPNPQSGNDEPVQREQLVDFLPEDEAEPHPPEEEVSVMERTASSSVAVGGAQSILQPEDPKEDDFGPVVDQTPTPEASILASVASIATNVTASEMRSLEKEDIIEARSVDFDLDEGKSKVVVDHVPFVRGKRTLDSLATVAQSQLTGEEEEEMDTASKFGPVVDHLPTPATSLAPSRGGSTVDALATVSEANSAQDGNDGWEDDLDLEDASAITDRTDRISTRGVRFDSSVRSSNLKSPPAAVLPKQPPVATRFEPSATDGWDDEDVAADAADMSSLASGDATKTFDHVFANADTPPSTPYERPVSLALPAESLLQPLLQECPSCANAKSMECPCVRKLLRITRDKKSLTGILWTPEGDSLEVDLGEVLEEEIAKRRLVEGEVEALRSMSSSRQAATEQLATEDSDLHSIIATMRSENQMLSEKMEELKTEGSLLRGNTRQLSQDLNESQRLVNVLNITKAELEERESARSTEIDGLKKFLDKQNDRSAAGEDLASALVSAEKKLLGKDSECQQLVSRVSRLENSLERAEASLQKSSLELDTNVSQYEERLARAEGELLKSRSALSDTSRALEKSKRNAEVNALNASKESDSLLAAKAVLSKQISELQKQHEREMQRQYALLDGRTKDLKSVEAKLKSSEVEKDVLANDLQKQRSLADESTNLASELLSVAKERDLLQEALIESKEAVNSLQSHIDDHGMERLALDSKRELEITTLKVDKKDIQDSLRVEQKRVEELKNALQEVQSEKENALADAETAQASVWDLQEQIDSSNGLCTEAEARASELEAQLMASERRLQEAQSRSQVADGEKIHLTSRVATLEKKLEMEKEDARQHASRADEAQRKLYEADEEIRHLRSELDLLSLQKSTLERNLRNAESQMSTRLQEEQHLAENAIRDREGEIHRLQHEVDTLREQIKGQQSLEIELNNAREWVGLLEKEKEGLVEENEELLVQFGLLKKQMDEAHAAIEPLHREMDAICTAAEAATNGGDYDANTTELSESARSVVETIFGLQTRYADLEEEMTHFSSDRERGLEQRIQLLEEENRHKQTAINSLEEQDQASSASNNAMIAHLKKNIETQQATCREKDHVIQNKTTEVSETNSHLAAVEGELALLQTSGQQSQVSAQQHRMAAARAETAENALQHSQTELERANAVVGDLELQLSHQEDSLREMRATQESSRRQASSDSSGLQRRAQSLEDEVSRKTAQISQLEDQLEKAERGKTDLSRQATPASPAEIQRLQEQVDSLTCTLQATHARLATKEEEMNGLSTQIRFLEEQPHGHQEQASPRLDDVAGDDVESLRTHVVSLATALERSETRRADAMDRLMVERRANADSIRRLGDSVQRFYTNVKLRDT